MKLTKKKKGNTLLGTVVSIFVILVIILIIFYKLQPLVVKMKVHQAGRAALLKMEQNGGITADIRQNIIDDLSSIPNFSVSDLIINPSIDVTPTSRLEYGAETNLSIEYNYKYKQLEFVDLVNVQLVNKTKQINFNMSTTNTRVK